MNNIQLLFENKVFIAAFIGWFVAQGTKLLLTFIKHGKLDLERVMGSGGMPSSHTSTITAATFQVGFTQGFNSPLFGLGLVVAFITMYDAAGVRMAAGKQASVIKQIMKEIGEHRFQIEGELKELLGHTYLEVFVGFILGILIGYLCSIML